MHQHSAKATFFVLGENVRKYPEAIIRAIKDGHEIGNHGCSHQALPLRSVRFIREEIRQTSDLIEREVGLRPGLFRAPYGWRNPWVNVCAKKLGCTPVAWTAGARDFTHPGVDVIVKRCVKKLKNGCILLFHDGCRTKDKADTSQVVAALPIILSEAQKAGFHFVTVSEMLKHKNLKSLRDL
jgi:peptidoglycan/xylan/chitin deacetylase (PgdA/CDA1 family)